MITVNGQQYEVDVEEVKSVKTAKPSASPAASVSAAPEKAVQANAPAAHGTTKINAPMPGSIVKVIVKKGDAVKKGQSLLILEAMKMENEITAPSDGKVSDIKVIKGDCVNLGQTLIELV
jgi:glutaconyl-CoA/methylmalonyl-CoA decarboxylase subunit gamma